MKLEITQNIFMKYWNTAERITGTKSTMATLASVLCKADGSGVTLSATDLKTSVKVEAQGAAVIEEGNAILPVKVVGELFKKMTSSPFTVEVDGSGKGTIRAGRSRYSFTTYDVGDFPDMPTPRAAEEFATVPAGELARVIAEGCIAGAPNEEFPKYISGGLLQIKNGELRVVATDGRRLSLSKAVIGGEDSSAVKEMLLPLRSIDEYQKIISSFQPDMEVEVLQDGNLTYFRTPGMVYSVRSIDSKFPNYEKILDKVITTRLKVGRQEFLRTLDRVNIVVGDSSRVVVMNLSPEAPLALSGRAPEIGEANETIDAEIDGEPLRVGFNIGYLMSGIKAFRGEEVCLSFNGADGQMTITHPDGSDFVYMLMPIKLKSQEMSGEA